MLGDIVFYRPRDPLDWLIATATHGPFSHIAVDLGNGFVIAAEYSGIKVYPENYHRTIHIPPPEGADISKGMAWLEKQQGLRYGFLDIFDQLIRLLFHFSFYVARPRSYDCSDLVTRYLLECGVDLGDLGQEPHLVTPNDLARHFGLGA